MTHPSLVETVLDAYHELRRAADRSPANEPLTRALSRLIAELSAAGTGGHDVGDIRRHPAIARIRGRLLRYLAEAEGELERHEARRLCDALAAGPPGIGLAELRRFRYWRNYRCLVKAELARLRPHLPAEAPLAFVGAGPLPLSALLMHAATGLPVTCIDADPEAAELARRLTSALGLDGAALSVVCAQGAHVDYAPFGCVVVASLVVDRRAVLERALTTAPDALLAVRSGEDRYELLYEPLDRALCDDLGLALLDRTEPDARMINTTTLLTPAAALVGAS